MAWRGGSTPASSSARPPDPPSTGWRRYICSIQPTCRVRSSLTMPMRRSCRGLTPNAWPSSPAALFSAAESEASMPSCSRSTRMPTTTARTSCGSNPATRASSMSTGSSSRQRRADMAMPAACTVICLTRRGAPGTSVSCARSTSTPQPGVRRLPRGVGLPGSRQRRNPRRSEDCQVSPASTAGLAARLQQIPDFRQQLLLLGRRRGRRRGGRFLADHAIEAAHHQEQDPGDDQEVDCHGD